MFKKCFKFCWEETVDANLLLGPNCSQSFDFVSVPEERKCESDDLAECPRCEKCEEK